MRSKLSSFMLCITDRSLMIDTCGTASMLPRDLGGVVDSELKVYGTQNLRIMDLSVLPLHISAHPQGKCLFALRHVPVV